MANKRELKLIEYGISRKRYKELCGYCEQYPEWLEELKNKTNTIKSKRITDMPALQGDGHDTERLAIRRIELQKKCKLIEQAAKEADAQLYEYIIKSVCFEKPYWYLKDIMGMPENRTDFLTKRRKFFYLLNLKKDVTLGDVKT